MLRHPVSRVLIFGKISSKATKPQQSPIAHTRVKINITHWLHLKKVYIDRNSSAQIPVDASEIGRLIWCQTDFLNASTVDRCFRLETSGNLKNIHPGNGCSKELCVFNLYGKRR